ncbi:MAG: hybrid sensor histidine kinase/response regulator [Hyphomicrobiales bacterium]
MTSLDESNRAAAAARRRVLVMDDDPLMREAMVALFADAGHDVTHAENGEDARAIAARQDFDLAVIDLGMPKLDGFGLLQFLRQHPRCADLPVIAATLPDDAQSIERAYRLGASSFVTKPVNWAQFIHHAQFVARNGEIERELRRARTEALAAVRMKNGLFQVMSHELKTPLIALIGLTGVLAAALKGRIEDIEAEQLEHIIDAAQRLNGMVTDIVLLSKALAGPRQLSIAAADAAALLDDGIVGLKLKAKQRNVLIKVSLPAPGMTIDCDAQLLRQAIKKLADNAIKYSPAGGAVEIWAEDRDDGPLIVVRDNGPGLSPARLEQCLLPFVRDDMSYARPAEGLGLGLPIAKAISEAHGGQLICLSAPGEGMAVSIRLPPRALSIAGAVAQ